MPKVDRDDQAGVAADDDDERVVSSARDDGISRNGMRPFLPKNVGCSLQNSRCEAAMLDMTFPRPKIRQSHVASDVTLQPNASRRSSLTNQNLNQNQNQNLGSKESALIKCHAEAD